MRRTILALLLSLPLIQGCDQPVAIGGHYIDDIEMVEDDLPEDEDDSDPTRLPGVNDADADVEGEGGSGGEVEPGDAPEPPGMDCRFWEDDTEQLDSPVTCPTWCEMHTWDVEGLDVPWYAMDCGGYLCILQENSYGPWHCYPGSCELNEDEMTSSCVFDHS